MCARAGGKGEGSVVCEKKKNVGMRMGGEDSYAECMCKYVHVLKVCGYSRIKRCRPVTMLLAKA